MAESGENMVRSLRHRMKMTQEQFAHALAVTVSTVNRWENAHSAPSRLASRAIRDLARRRGVGEDGVHDPDAA